MRHAKQDLEGTGVQTRAVHAADPFNATTAVAPPIWQTSTFRADSPDEFLAIATATRPEAFYTRYGNPTHRQVEATLAALEGGEGALVTSSGMAAMFTAVLGTVSKGDHVVAQKNHYAGTTALLRDVAPRFGVEATFVDAADTAAFEAAMRPTTRLVVVESPVNPLLTVTDVAAVAAIAHAHGALVVADNTFATPVNQRPLELGADLVVHSATKYLGGHHDLTAGAIVGARARLDRLWSFAIVAGATLGPFDGWLLLRGLRTLGLRVARHNESAVAVARALAKHPAVARVFYPGLSAHPGHAIAAKQMKGFGGMLAIELAGGFDAAERFVSRLELATRAASLGGFETLVVHPAAMWAHQMSAEQRAAAGISDALVRISIGLEDVGDLLADFRRALEAA
ncbi:MAG TPA: aminotransferase class I/II-fold pyridoxal phosphate-dependent enzyme [Minicystis sp.]|nr:aminotransferase class I/II-fold pyridoxal phosphate-dependent enzyme [Minicystis sp.]